MADSNVRRERDGALLYDSDRDGTGDQSTDWRAVKGFRKLTLFASLAGAGNLLVEFSPDGGATVFPAAEGAVTATGYQIHDLPAPFFRLTVSGIAAATKAWYEAN